MVLAAISTMVRLGARAQSYDTNNVVVQTIAGSGFSGLVNGQGVQTMFNGPTAIVADSSSNLYVFDYYNDCIREIAPSGAVSTFAGGGQGGYTGYGTNVTFPVSAAESMTIDHSNTIYFVEYPTGTTLFRIAANGFVSTVPLAGLAGGAVQDGICVDSGNNVYIADNNGNKIYRFLTNGVLQTFAGSGNAGYADGNGIFCSFDNPSALTADSADNIYVWDSGTHLVRRIDQSENVVTIAGNQGYSTADGLGTNACFYNVSSMCSDGVGNIYLASFALGGGSSIRKISATTNVTTLAGSFTQHGFADGSGPKALFGFGGNGVCFSQGTIYVADCVNERIRQISFNPSPQIVTGANLAIGIFPGVTITGIVGRTYQIQSSPDMAIWATVSTVLLNSSPYLWIDQNQTTRTRYYRAILLP